MCRILRFVLFFFSLNFIAHAEYAIDSSLEGPTSPYTEPIKAIIKHWPPRQRALPPTKSATDPIAIQCFETPGSEFYIGAEQTMVVFAPLARVDAIVADVDHYQDIFPDFKDIHVVSRDGNRWLTFWEQKVPVFFVSNIKYEMNYVTERLANRSIYRYQLRKSEKIKVSDGVIVLEKMDANQTRYTEYDFWDADYGILKTLAPGRIWKDSIEGLFRSDVAFKLRAENPGWDNNRIRNQALELFKDFSVQRVIEHKKKFPKLVTD